MCSSNRATIPATHHNVGSYYRGKVQPLGIHHVSLNVRDLAESLHFFVDVVGLKERTDRPTFSFVGSWLDVGGGGQQLHLLEIEGFEAPAGQHFAMAVTDLDEAIASLRTKGVQVSEPQQLSAICRQAFFKDPTGNLIELNQPLQSPKTQTTEPQGLGR